MAIWPLGSFELAAATFRISTSLFMRLGSGHDSSGRIRTVAAMTKGSSNWDNKPVSQFGSGTQSSSRDTLLFQWMTNARHDFERDPVLLRVQLCIV
jgi:hypothetical protein